VAGCVGLRDETVWKSVIGTPIVLALAAEDSLYSKANVEWPAT